MRIDGRSNAVQGNFIGTDITGTAPLGNEQNGLINYGIGNVIGGTEPGTGNLISANLWSGLFLSGSFNSIVQGNWIGTDITGTEALGNGQHGVAMAVALNDLVGGTGAGARNLISGNAWAGVRVFSRWNNLPVRIQGNFIGTDITGSVALGNQDGILLEAENQNVLIGGPTPGAGNLISGNHRHGVRFAGLNISGTRLQGNFIGTDPTGTQALGNGENGISLESGIRPTLIGGSPSGEGNHIAFNGKAGVTVAFNPSGENPPITMLGNAIFANGTLGIDLGNNGITLNDLGDADSGPNHLQNFPVLTWAVATPTGTTIRGSLSSTPNASFRVEFFHSAANDPSGHGEGEAFLGATTVTTDATGTTSFRLTFPFAVPRGHWITATATDASGNTSEFSLALQAGHGSLGQHSTAASSSDSPMNGTEETNNDLEAALAGIAISPLISSFSSAWSLPPPTRALAEIGRQADNAPPAELDPPRRPHEPETDLMLIDAVFAQLEEIETLFHFPGKSAWPLTEDIKGPL